jgi:hypothetical protein
VRRGAAVRKNEACGQRVASRAAAHWATVPSRAKNSSRDMPG